MGSASSTVFLCSFLDSGISFGDGPHRLLAVPCRACCHGTCIAASPDCTEWIAFPGGARSLVYRTYSLDAKNTSITRALVMVHGAGRDADNYFRTAVAAAILGGALDDTIVISPRFASNDGRGCRDALAQSEVSWSCNGDSWRSGGISTSNDNLTSYDFADEILHKLARKDAFPNLKMIVVAGHSAGGQYVTRYEMATKVHDTLGVPIRYVVANPSSYAYLDPTPKAPTFAPSTTVAIVRPTTIGPTVSRAAPAIPPRFPTIS
jgi:pimeloyl-ACP methyl ester carboxylesterase